MDQQTQMQQTLTLAPPPERRPRKVWRSIQRERKLPLSSDLALGLLVRLAAVAILLMLGSLLFILARAAVPSIRTFGWSFVTKSDWQPNELSRPKRGPDGKVVKEDGEVVMETVPPSFGALFVIYGTVTSSALALVFAVPLSLGAAVFLVRVAPRLRIAAPVSFLIEFLAAVPSIAYGIWGRMVLVPFLQQQVEPRAKAALDGVTGFNWLFHRALTGRAVEIPLTGFDMLAGGLILGIMVLPIITAVSRDVLAAVPRAQIEGTLALGATWWQSCREMLRYSRSGLFGAIMLGLARAAGETMAVTMVIGNANQIVPSIFAPAQTMASLLASRFSDPENALERAALLEVALILLVMSLMFNVVARYFVVGGQSRTAAAH